MPTKKVKMIRSRVRPNTLLVRNVRDHDGDVAVSQGSWSGTSAVASDADDGEQDHELFLEACLERSA